MDKEIAIKSKKLCSWIGTVKFYNDSINFDDSKRKEIDKLEDNLNYYENLLEFDISKKTLIRFYFSGYQFFKKKAESKLWFRKLRYQGRRDEFWNLYCSLVNSKPVNHNL